MFDQKDCLTLHYTPGSRCAAGLTIRNMVIIQKLYIYPEYTLCRIYRYIR